MNITSRHVSRLLIGAAFVALAAPTMAQTAEEAEAQAQNPAPGDTVASTEDDVIYVTATKRSTRVQDVPFSINAQT